ncbi:MAG: hypothetical protein C0622_13300 [Desulfuromonas sp.]|nr:MAG: hypothetical protein C0622_13300 [Desulfuromonas sp.]
MGDIVKKILIVDDEKSFLLSLKDGLQKHKDKFEVVTAHNGREAVEVLRKTAIDLLVTDLKMPEMNGFELLAWVGKYLPQLPVIVMTAFGTPEIEARCKQMDTLQFLEKPLDLQMLEEGIINGLNVVEKSFIRGITLATFLQLVKAEQKTCTLKVLSEEGKPAYLFLRRGDLIDAECGKLSGMPAALEIVSWDDAEIEMDGVCRRQEDKIQMSLEHVLMESFRIKDEAAEQERAGGQEAAKEQSAAPAAAAAPAGGDDDPLVAALEKMPPVVGFAVFDNPGEPASKSSRNCSLTHINPAVFEEIAEALTEDLGCGAYRSIVLHAGSRNRFLLFRSQGKSVISKIKPGTQPRLLLKEIDRALD